MQKKYRVVLRAESSVKIGNKGERFSCVYKIGDQSVICNFIDIYKQDSHGTEYHNVIQVEVELEEENIDKAMEKAGGITNFFMTFMSFVTGAAIAEPRFYLAYDITEGTEKREHTQYFYDIGIPGLGKRKIDFKKYDDLLKKVEASQIEQRLLRGMRWYRKSLMEEDNLDRFTNLWIGLETLNKPLIEKFNLDSREESSDIGKITKVLSKLRKKLRLSKDPPPTIKGIRYLFENHLVDGKNIYKRVRKVRQGLMHGFGRLSHIVSESKSLIPELELGIVKAIFFLLEMQPEEYRNLMRESLINHPLPSLRVGCLLHESVADKLIQDGEHPYFQDEHIILESKTESNGSTIFTIKSGLHPKFKCEYTPLYRELRGPKKGLIVKKVEDK